MPAIGKETIAPLHFESLRREHRVKPEDLVPEIVFALFLCGGIRKRIGLEAIAAQATMTYPVDFYTWVNGEPVPDLALMLLTLSQANSPDWHYTIGDWSNGWHLTKRGLRFAKDVERHRVAIRNH